ncbi:Trimethyllysine dioxygenase, mitochondrial [Armadillidium vulgare]|nr:Trimethyllysine dioxygenase, mitochondrial [Armadillidium vulgare]
MLGFVITAGVMLASVKTHFRGKLIFLAYHSKLDQPTYLIMRKSCISNVSFDGLKQTKEEQKKLLENILTHGIGIVDQVFHCLKLASEGGESFYVDGFHIGEKLYNEDPACYEYLSTTALPVEYLKDGHHFVNDFRIFTHHPVSKKLMQFRYNEIDRAPLSTIPYHEVDKFYMNFQKLVKMIRDERHEVEILLQPGQVAFIDNWRVTHGRKSFRGNRVLGGCYLGNTDFLSKARINGLKFE